MKLMEDLFELNHQKGIPCYFRTSPFQNASSQVFLAIHPPFLPIRREANTIIGEESVLSNH